MVMSPSRLRIIFIPFTKSLRSGTCAKNIVADQKVGMFSFGDKFFGCLDTEEFEHRRDPFFDGGCSNILGRLNP